MHGQYLHGIRLMDWRDQHMCLRRFEPRPFAHARDDEMTAPLQFLLDYLETADVKDRRKTAPFRMPVQSVDAGSRAFTGTVASGGIKAGDEIVVLPSGRTTTVKGVTGPGGSSARAGDVITVTLADEIEAAAGDMLADGEPAAGRRSVRGPSGLDVERSVAARPILLHEDQRLHARGDGERTQAKLDVDTSSKLAAKTLALNEIGVCNLSIARAIAVRCLRRQPRRPAPSF